MASTTENTPLIHKDSPPTEPRKPWLRPIHLILLCGFLVSTSFGVTQVPLIYVFRVMTCDAYYEKHPKPSHGPHDDICSIPQIEAGTARAVALLGASTVFFGIANLFITGWGIKRFGVKASLALQVFWPAGRLAIQNVGVMTGGATGIILVQCSQIATIVGGPQGYLLALNTYVTEVTGHRERTGALGRLQGCNMFGTAVGGLIGGILAEEFDIITPFQVTLALFLLSTIYVLLCLPYIPPSKKSTSSKPSGPTKISGPLKTLMPSKWILPSGQLQTEYGAVILAAGVFLAVLATGYIPTMLQMYATDLFGFRTRRNSYLVFLHTFLRGLFLYLAFPRIISLGRRWMEKRDTARIAASTSSTPPQSGTATPNTYAQFATAIEQDEEEQDVLPPKPPPGTSSTDSETFAFDLIYTRFSLLADGILTLAASFVSAGWQMYLVAALLPFGAGTASAAKGTILQMCPQSERTDALSAIAFVEMIARLGTTFVFGLIFAAFASISKTYLVFTCNAGVALVGFVVLLGSRFPPEGAKRVERKGSVFEEEEA